MDKRTRNTEKRKKWWCYCWPFEYEHLDNSQVCPGLTSSNALSSEIIHSMPRVVLSTSINWLPVQALYVIASHNNLYECSDSPLPRLLSSVSKGGRFLSAWCLNVYLLAYAHHHLPFVASFSAQNLPHTCPSLALLYYALNILYICLCDPRLRE
jgi:hypothetical protein